MKFPSEIEQYIDAKQHWRGELMFLRALLLETGMEETIKWGAPVYCKDGKNIVGICAFKDYVGLWFFQGGLLEDKEKRLMNAQEGKTKALRQWRFKFIQELIKDKALIQSYIQEAIANHDAGKAIKPERGKTKKPLIIPAELEIAFLEDEALKNSFNTLSLSHKRTFADYISEAKRNSTKERRLKKIIPMILEGRGLWT